MCSFIPVDKCYNHTRYVRTYVQGNTRQQHVQVRTERIAVPSTIAAAREQRRDRASERATAGDCYFVFFFIAWHLNIGIRSRAGSGGR